MDDDKPKSGIVIPTAVFWGLVVPLVLFISSASYYMANLSTTVASQGTSQATNQAAISARITAVENKVDINKDAGINTTAIINDRLTRMEAQLGFLVKASEGHK